MQYQMIVEKTKTGFSAYSLDFPVFTTGESEEEVLNNALEAFNLLFEDFGKSIGISQNTSLATVAPGIAEALVATAFGLLAAIPAVMAYNAFSSHMKKLNSKLDGFATEFLNILTSHAKK